MEKPWSSPVSWSVLRDVWTEGVGDRLDKVQCLWGARTHNPRAARCVPCGGFIGEGWLRSSHGGTCVMVCLL